MDEVAEIVVGWWSGWRSRRVMSGIIGEDAQRPEMRRSVFASRASDVSLNDDVALDRHSYRSIPQASAASAAMPDEL